MALRRSLADLDITYVYLDGFALRARRAGRVVSVPVLGVIGVLPDGYKHLLALELCGGESFPAWKGCLDDLVARGLRTPLLAIIDGNAGLRRAVELVWPRAAVQRCCVHKLRNLKRKAPKHALAEIRDDFHRIVHAINAEAARTAYTAFERTWAKRCPGVVTSLREGGDQLLTFFRYPKAQCKTLRTTNTIERLHEGSRRRVKTHGLAAERRRRRRPALQPRGQAPDFRGEGPNPDLDAAFKTATSQRADALMTLPGPVVELHRTPLVVAPGVDDGGWV